MRVFDLSDLFIKCSQCVKLNANSIPNFVQIRAVLSLRRFSVRSNKHTLFYTYIPLQTFAKCKVPSIVRSLRKGIRYQCEFPRFVVNGF